MPYEVSDIAYILLKIVRPLEIFPILQFMTKSGAEETQRVISLYKTSLYVASGKPLSSSKLSQILGRWFENGLGFEMGLHYYRHFAIALQRRYRLDTLQKLLRITMQELHLTLAIH
ncbi:hypothetical protein DENSPDRAFT_845048, partial [Dentipellis sp. KUC8613]